MTGPISSKRQVAGRPVSDANQKFAEDPEWCAAYEDYLSDDGEPDEKLNRRLRAAEVMRDIEVRLSGR